MLVSSPDEEALEDSFALAAKVLLDQRRWAVWRREPVGASDDQ
jgi:hypothetical protein